MAVLEAKDLHKSYVRTGQATTHVLRGASLSVNPGEFVVLMGPSGAGKSTMLHIMASLDSADSGAVKLRTNQQEHRYDTMSVSELSRLRNQHIGVVFQFHHLLPEFTALENVMMPMLIAGEKTSKATEQARELLRRVGLSHRELHTPLELSGGEQQRVAIARALVNRPTVLFADEPTGNLDSENAAAIVDVLVSLRASEGLTCIVATHSADLASHAHRVLHMKDGIVTS